MNFNIVSSERFDKETKRLARKFPSIRNDLSGLFNSLLTKPIQGIPLGNDCYKIRMAIASKGKGKSGGARIITCVKIVATTVYLLTIYDKSEKADISKNELRQILKTIF